MQSSRVHLWTRRTFQVIVCVLGLWCVQGRAEVGARALWEALSLLSVLLVAAAPSLWPFLLARIPTLALQ